ncbi:MAG: hypothetical protein AAGM38_15550 [Pseudomonadota bacterium]
MQFFQKNLRCFAAIAAVAMLSACATDGSNVVKDTQTLTRSTENMTPEQLELYRLQQKGAEIRLLAGGIGAVAGFFLSRVACRQRSGVQKTICTAGVTGAVALAAYNGGAYLAAKREDAEANRDDLESSLAAANSTVDYYQERVDAAEKVTAQHQKRIRELNQGYQAGTVMKAAYAAELEEMRADRDAIASFVEQSAGDIEFMEKEIKYRRQGGENTRDLEAKRDELQQRNIALSAELRELDAAFGSAPADVVNV